MWWINGKINVAELNFFPVVGFPAFHKSFSYPDLQIFKKGFFLSLIIYFGYPRYLGQDSKSRREYRTARTGQKGQGIEAG
jgi:hypothetical protein